MELRWTAHPARRRPQDVALVAAVALLTAWAVLESLRSPYLALLAVALLVASVASFLVPTHYRLDDDGVEERRLGQRKFRRWSDLRRVEVGTRAALVSPFARRHWLDRFRGIVVQLDGADREAVIACLRARIAAPAEKAS